MRNFSAINYGHAVFNFYSVNAGEYVSIPLSMDDDENVNAILLSLSKAFESNLMHVRRDYFTLYPCILSSDAVDLDEINWNKTVLAPSESAVLVDLIRFLRYINEVVVQEEDKGSASFTYCNLNTGKSLSVIFSVS